MFNIWVGKPSLHWEKVSVVVESLGSGTGLTGFISQSHHLHAAWLWAGYLNLDSASASVCLPERVAVRVNELRHMMLLQCRLAPHMLLFFISRAWPFSPVYSNRQSYHCFKFQGGKKMVWVLPGIILNLYNDLKIIVILTTWTHQPTQENSLCLIFKIFFAAYQ